MSTDTDDYLTITAFGVVHALFDADAEGVRLEGPADAVAAVERAIAASTNRFGMTMTLDSIEPADYFNFCQGKTIMIIEPADVSLMPPSLDEEGEGAAVLDAANPIMIRVLSGGKQIGTMTPDEFRVAAKAPRSMFLGDVIKRFNEWKAEQGEPERVEQFLPGAKPAKRLDAVADLAALREQARSAPTALARLAAARAIQAAREEPDPEPGLSAQDYRDIASTIWKQLGGGKFKAMTGAKDVLALTEGNGGLRFSLPTGFSQKDGKSTGINRVFIRLNASDTYDVEFGGARGKNYTVRATTEDIYADNLREVFTRYTGLDTSMGTAFARPKISLKDAREAYELLGYLIDDLQGHTDMELARPDSTDRIEAHVEQVRRMEPDWPNSDSLPRPRNLIERADGVIDRAKKLREEGGLVEIGLGDLKSYVLRNYQLTDEQRAALMAKTSRVTRSGTIDVPRYNLKEVSAMAEAFEAANKAPAAVDPYDAAADKQQALNARFGAIVRALESGGLTRDSDSSGLAWVMGGVRVFQSQGDIQAQRTLKLEPLAFSRFDVKSPESVGTRIDDDLSRTPEQTAELVLAAVKADAGYSAQAGQSEQFKAYAKAIAAGKATPGMLEVIKMDTRLNDGEAEQLADMASTIANPAPAGPRFRYALVNRPADLGTIPKGLAYTVEPRPAAGQPHHDMARHGILVTERELTVEELKAFELAPLVDGQALQLMADRIAEGMREYAAGYAAESRDEPSQFRVSVLEAVKASGSGVRYSVGDPDALVTAVAERVRAMAVTAAPDTTTTVTADPPAGDPANAADVALLTQIADGKHPDMLSPELADVIEAAMLRHEADADMQALAERAITAYSAAMLAAT